MTGRIAHQLALLLLVPTLGLCQGVEIPFAMPVPDGWRTETLFFPLEFAPDLPYSGLEELRFAPGMFQEGAEDFWSYAFVWWVGSEEPTGEAALAAHLESYFRGLSTAVGETREVDVSGARFAAEIHPAESGGFAGTAETFDPFTTHDQIVLRLRGWVRPCPSHGRQAVLFELSPQQYGHPIWTELDSIGRGFRCTAPLRASERFESRLRQEALD